MGFLGGRLVVSPKERKQYQEISPVDLQICMLIQKACCGRLSCLEPRLARQQRRGQLLVKH